jgi:hypothetical protein
MNRPIMEEQPGPPFSHRTTGSFLGSLRDSKNPGGGSQQMESVQANQRRTGKRQLTVEQMLIIGLVIQITAVLLDLVDAQDRRINLLGTQIVRLEGAINLAMADTISLYPNALYVGALNNVVPFTVRFALVGFGVGDDVLGLLHEAGDQKAHLAPEALSVGGHLSERLLKGLECVLCGFDNRLDGILDAAEHMLLLLGDGNRGRAEQQR